MSLSANDYERSATAAGTDFLKRSLAALDASRIDRVLDIGCGFGGLSRLVADYVSARYVVGLDVDQGVFEEVKRKGVAGVTANVDVQGLPFKDEQFDLIVSLGVWDYFRSFDGIIEEIHRVLRPGGFVVVSLPNLGSWHNRILLLFGYQPRDVEISDVHLVGTPRIYRSDSPSGHIHTPTLHAFRDLMALNGFECLEVIGGSWATRRTPKLILLVDRLISRRAALARRFFYVGRKTHLRSGSPPPGWWQRVRNAERSRLDRVTRAAVTRVRPGVRR